jgi:hypothetical protein
MENRGIDGAKETCGGADSNGKREEHDSGKAGSATEAPEGEAEIAEESIHRSRPGLRWLQAIRVGQWVRVAG